MAISPKQLGHGNRPKTQQEKKNYFCTHSCHYHICESFATRVSGYLLADHELATSFLTSLIALNLANFPTTETESVLYTQERAF